MPGGMRIDPKELPLPMQEQVAVKMLAQVSAPSPVAGGKKPRKVAVRRLVFPCPGAAARYQELRQKVRDGKLMHVQTVTYRHLRRVVELRYWRWGETEPTVESTDIWR